MTEQPVQWPSEFGMDHMLSFLYLSFAAHSDHELSAVELETIAEKVGEWGSGNNPGVALQETLEFWKGTTGCDDAVLMAAVCMSMKQHLPDDARALVYQDLVAVAEADNVVKPREVEGLELLKSQLGL